MSDTTTFSYNPKTPIKDLSAAALASICADAFLSLNDQMDVTVTRLVTLNSNWLSKDAIDGDIKIEMKIDRKTRTLLFASAILTAGDIKHMQASAVLSLD